MVDPKIMCRQHLLGEHVELHMFVGALKKEKSIDGFIKKGLLEPGSIKNRHNKLVEEMNRRGMNHRSEIEVPSLAHLPQNQAIYKINPVVSKTELLKRCSHCRARYNDVVRT